MARDRLHKEQDISRIAKDVRNMKIALRKQGYNGHKKMRIKNSAKNIIEMDSELTEIESLSYDEYNFPELEEQRHIADPIPMAANKKVSRKDSYHDSELVDLQTLKNEINKSDKNLQENDTGGRKKQKKEDGDEFGMQEGESPEVPKKESIDISLDIEKDEAATKTKE